MNKKDLIALLKDPDVEAALGTIMLKAVDQALIRTVKVESGRDNPGGPPVIKEEKWNILDFIAKMIPYQEGALRGMQTDANKAANHSGQTYFLLGNFLRKWNEVFTDFQKTRRIGNAERLDQEVKAIQGPGC